MVKITVGDVWAGQFKCKLSVALIAHILCLYVRTYVYTHTQGFWNFVQILNDNHLYSITNFIYFKCLLVNPHSIPFVFCKKIKLLQGRRNARKQLFQLYFPIIQLYSIGVSWLWTKVLNVIIIIMMLNIIILPLRVLSHNYLQHKIFTDSRLPYTHIHSLYLMPLKKNTRKKMKTFFSQLSQKKRRSKHRHTHLNQKQKIYKQTSRVK